MDLREYRKILLHVFIGLVLATIVLAWYREVNPFRFVGAVERFVWIDFAAGLLLAALFLPDIDEIKIPSKYKKIITNSRFVKKLNIIKEKLKIRKPKILEKIPKPDWSKFKDRKYAINVIFQCLLIAFLSLLLARELISNFMSFININYFLGLVIFFGIISIMQEPNEPEPEKKDLTKRDYIFIFALGMAGALIIWYKTQSIGSLSYAISAVSAVLIILLSTLVLEE